MESNSAGVVDMAKEEKEWVGWKEIRESRAYEKWYIENILPIQIDIHKDLISSEEASSMYDEYLRKKSEEEKVAKEGPPNDAPEPGL